MSQTSPTEPKLPPHLVWLADAPLFIDADQVDRFHDAVVRPETVEGSTTLQITEEKATRLSGKLSSELAAKVGAKAKLSPSEVLNMLLTVFPFVKPEGEVAAEVAAKGGAEGAAERNRRKGETKTITLHPIRTPQRQLEHLTLHYLINHPDRLLLVSDPASESWRQEELISEVPRAVVFLDLPGQAEASPPRLPETKIIPTAAEFGNGEVVQLYAQLTGKDGSPPPDYPEPKPGQSLEALREERKSYWSWFDKNYSATRAMVVVEEASSERKGIRWIDFRIPLTENGDTLHLHVTPAGTYDTGTFAYNFIKRGFKHGLRLVGTLKSEPSMNVLAIYEK